MEYFNAYLCECMVSNIMMMIAHFFYTTTKISFLETSDIYM